ncbi:MAG: hypothetical protein H7833_04475 [Magnetococcus sp. DMHC-1]|nr:hypothetical protein [Magnetococcales bacterium]
MEASGALSSIPNYDPKVAAAGNKSADATNGDKQQIDFLKMLSAQLEYQDPMEPMQNTEFTAQMAQFSALSEQKKSNTLLEQLINSKSSDQVNQAVSYIGKRVFVSGDGFDVQDGTGGVRFELPKDASASIRVFDPGGHLVKEVPSRSFSKGENTVDVNDPRFGLPLPDGQYKFAVQVEGDSSVQATLLQSGVVTGVTRQGTGILLDLDGHTVPVDDVRRVEQVGSRSEQIMPGVSQTTPQVEQTPASVLTTGS